MLGPFEHGIDKKSVKNVLVTTIDNAAGGGRPIVILDSTVRKNRRGSTRGHILEESTRSLTAASRSKHMFILLIDYDILSERWHDWSECDG